MSTTRTPAAGGRPRRRTQVIIWLLFAAALVVGLSLSTAGSGIDPTVAHTATTAADEHLTVAAGAPGADSPLLRKTYAEDPSQLLPAYRWQGSLQLPSAEDYGIVQGVIAGGLTHFANLLFFVAAWIWVVLMWIVKLAVGTDLIGNAAGQIDSLFHSVASGLGDAGIPVLIVAVAVLLGALRAMRGKLNQAISMVLGAALVVGALSFFTAAASGPQHTYRVDGSEVKAASVGSPAYLAQRGNNFVNQMVDQVVTGFGTTSSLTAAASTGSNSTMGDSDGATCNFYNQQLVSTYKNYTTAATGSQGKLEANTLTMVSYMWQRALYDNWTAAAFGTTGDGARIACHQLETNRGVDYRIQFALVGGNDNGEGSASAGPYAGMKNGPFLLPQAANDRRDRTGAALAWAACGGGNGHTARAGWKDVGHGPDDGDCENWWSWDSGSDGPGVDSDWEEVNELGVNKDGGDVLSWNSYDDVRSAMSVTDSSASAEAVSEVRSVTAAFYGQNGGGRILSGLVSIVTAALYAWAFGAAAIGTLFTQIGLLFFLSLLPYTLLLLAFPQKDGGRNKTGVRMLKMTGAFFGGKIVFLTLMGVSIQLMGMLYTVASSIGGGEGVSAAGGSVSLAAGSGSGGPGMVWSMLIPAATIFVLRMATKALGLGDLMSLSGAAGFATSAVMSGKENRKARSQFQGAMNGSVLSRADKAVKGGLGKAAKSPVAGVKAMSEHFKDKHATEDRKKELEDARAAVAAGQLPPELGAAVAAGKMSLAEATAIANGTLDPSLLGAVRSGQLSREEAEAMSSAMSEGRKAIDGFEGALGRLGALGELEDGEHSPIFGDAALEASADHAALRQDQTDRRYQLEVKNKDVVDEAEWERNAVASILENMEALRAGSQGVDFGRALTPGEVAAEKAQIAKDTGIPEHMILLGDSGAPPLIAPLTRDIDGNFQWPDGLPDHVMHKLAMNPLNFLDIAKLEGEGPGQFHLRAALELQAAGGMDFEGNFANVLKAEGIDIDTATGREALTEAILGIGPVRLEDIQLSLPEVDRGTIGAAVRAHYPDAPVTQQLAQVEHISAVETLARQAHSQAIQLNTEVQQTVQQILAAPDHADMANTLDRLLRVMEEKVPAAVRDLGAVSLEASVVDQYVLADGFDAAGMMAAATEMARSGEQLAESLSATLTNQVAQIKLAAPDLQADLLRDLSGFVSDAIGGCTDDVQRSMRSLLENAAEADRTRQQHLASQLSAPVRSSDFAGGARPLELN